MLLLLVCALAQAQKQRVGGLRGQGSWGTAGAEQGGEVGESRGAQIGRTKPRPAGSILAPSQSLPLAQE